MISLQCLVASASELSEPLDLKIKEFSWQRNYILEPSSDGKAPNSFINFVNQIAQTASYPLINILPNPFHIISSKENGHLQRLIDSSFLQISNTSIGKEVCYNITGADINKIILAYGVSKTTAIKLSKNCSNTSSPSAQPKIKKIFPRSYHFIITSSENYAADSWTDRHNNTFLFIQPGLTSQKDLMKMLIHEVAVSFDEKEEISSFIGITYYDNTKLELELLQANDTDIKSALFSPIIKYAFVSLRAERIERLLLNQLNGEALNSNLDCGNKLYNKIIEVASTSPLNFQIEHNFSQFKTGLTTKLDYFKLSKKLDKTILINNNLNLCQYLSEPQISNLSFSVTSGGPKPRVGGGTNFKPVNIDTLSNDTAAKINDLINKQQNSGTSVNLPNYWGNYSQIVN